VKPRADAWAELIFNFRYMHAREFFFRSGNDPVAA
jgi:hypothetical protein